MPRGYAGIRFTHTLYQTDDQIGSLIESMARHVPEIIDEPEIVIDLTGARAESP